jgi:hypothetical protein
MELVKMVPTWRNFHSNEETISKRLDRFFISENLLTFMFLFKSWVSFGGLSDHLRVLFHMAMGRDKPPTPLKFNRVWLQEEDFKKAIKDSWIPLSMSLCGMYMQ